MPNPSPLPFTRLGLASVLRSGYKREVLTDRIGNPEEAAEVIVWMCSDAASYVTGHSMIVDGGLTARFR